MASSVVAVLPYTTFPAIAIGPVSIRTFGLLVGTGLVVGAFVAVRYIHGRTDVDERPIYAAAAWLAVAGVIGARTTWVLSHLEVVDGPLDALAVWRGGLQFSGGFLGAIVLGFPLFRRWPKAQRWVVIDGFAVGLSAGLAIGRIGCIAVGEHFGRPSSGWLAVRYEGGETRERLLGSEPLTVGRTFHHTALYELIGLVVLTAVLLAVARRSPPPGTLMALFCSVYGFGRYSSDYLRVNDERLYGLTGAQYLMTGIVVASFWIWFRVVPGFVEADGASGAPPSEDPLAV